MRRNLLLLALAASFSTAALAQTAPASADTQPGATATKPKGRVLTNREKRRLAKEAQRAQAAAWNASAADVAYDRSTYRMTWSSAPGIPLNQVGHGVTTDYNGRPLRRPAAPGASANTTLPGSDR